MRENSEGWMAWQFDAPPDKHVGNDDGKWIRRRPKVFVQSRGHGDQIRQTLESHRREFESLRAAG